MTLGEKIRALRKERGMTLRAFGSLFGMKDTGIAYWEAQTSLRREIVEVIAGFFGQTADEFVADCGGDNAINKRGYAKAHNPKQLLRRKGKSEPAANCSVIVKNIFRMREARGWSQTGLAVRIGSANEGIVARWENGKIEPTRRQLELVMEEFDCDMSDLLRAV